MAKKFCTSCGNELENDTLFCTKCGAKVEEFQTETKEKNSKEEIVQEDNNVENPYYKNKKSHNISTCISRILTMGFCI